MGRWSSRDAVVIGLVTAVLAVIGAVAGLAASDAFGAPRGEVAGRGTATVESCSQDWLRFGQTYRCRSSVRWDGGTPPRRETILAYERIDGRVDVVLRKANCGGRGSCVRTVTPADIPDRPDLGWLVPATPITLGVLGLAISGLLRHRSHSSHRR